MKAWTDSSYPNMSDSRNSSMPCAEKYDNVQFQVLKVKAIWNIPGPRRSHTSFPLHGHIWGSNHERSFLKSHPRDGGQIATILSCKGHLEGWFNLCRSTVKQVKEKFRRCFIQRFRTSGAKSTFTPGSRTNYPHVELSIPKAEMNSYSCRGDWG